MIYYTEKYATEKIAKNFARLLSSISLLVRLCTSPTVSENVFRAFFVAFVVFFECRSSNIRWISSSLSGSVLSAIAAILT